MQNRSPGGFHTVELNLYGWTALIAAGVVLGALVAGFTDIAWWATIVAGVAVVWGTVLVLDHRRFRNSMIHLGDNRLDPDTGAAVVARLKEMGITASYVEQLIDEEDGGGIQRSILCQQRDANAVSRFMAEGLS